MNLAMIVTEKCNLQCEHCMRGTSTNKDISCEVIDKTLDQILAIGVLNICGGEPTYAIDKIKYIFDSIRKKKILVDCIYTVINGTNYSEELLELYSEMAEYKYIEKLGFEISNDVFHKKELVRLGLYDQTIENIRKYTKSEFFGGFRTINYKLFNEGRAVSLDKEITTTLKPVHNVICYAGKKERLINIGPLVTVNTSGNLTECDASTYHQETKYNYGSILEDKIIDIYLRNGAKVVSPIRYNFEIKKEIKKRMKD